MKRPFFFLAVILIIFILFVSRLSSNRLSFFAGHVSNFVSSEPRRLPVKARVISNPYYEHAYFKKTQVFIVRPELVRVSKLWFPAYGDIRVTSYNDKEVKYGDELLFEARLKSPSTIDGSLYYKKYLERGGIYAIATITEKDPIVIIGKKASFLKSIAYDLKGLLRRNFERLFKAPERHFLQAVLLGERQDIPKEWKDIFIKTQTIHLLAISGLHVGIIAFIILFIAGVFGIPRIFKYTITILILVFYAIMVGGMPSVMRATVMGVTIMGSYILKRDADIYNSLGLAATVILVFNPDQLFDAGFILSFASVLSIIYMTPMINMLLRIDKIDRTIPLGGLIYYLSTLISASLAVWVGLLPLTANLFNIVSPISVFVNILAIPFLFVIACLSISALIFQPIFSFLGVIFAESAELFIGTLLSSLRLFSKLPLAYFEVGKKKTFPVVTVIIYYLALIIFFEWIRLRKGLGRRQISI